MGDNVSKIRRRLHSKQFGSKFPRLERANLSLSPEHITDELKAYYPHSKEGFVYCLAKECPSDDLELEIDFDVNKILNNSNSLLMYRILNLLYGEPDILGAFIQIPTSDKERPTFLPVGIEWGYTVQARDGLIAEVRTIYCNSIHRTRLWIPKKLKKELSKETVKEAVLDFFVSLDELLEKNFHLFNESDDLKALSIKGTTASANIFMEYYNAAQRLRELGDEYDINPNKDVIRMRALEFTEPIPVDTPGYIYTPAAIMFIISLEALINTFYFYQLKNDYRQEAYKRLTMRGDLDLRLATIHLFCKGFIKQPVLPGSDLWKKIIKLRTFRNSVFHGNKADEHDVHILSEDKLTFYYSPRLDFRGLRKFRRKGDQFVVAMREIDDDVVSETVGIVDDVIEALLAALDGKTRAWVKSWLWEAIIPPRLGVE